VAAEMKAAVAAPGEVGVWTLLVAAAAPQMASLSLAMMVVPVVVVVAVLQIAVLVEGSVLAC
jgi:hypothetical protein